PVIGPPPFVARAENQLHAAAERPAILPPDRQRPRPPARRLGQRARLAVPPVARRIAVAREIEPVAVEAEAEIVRGGVPAAAACAEIERPPAGAVEPHDRAGASGRRRRERTRRKALHVAVEVVKRADRAPVEAEPVPLDRRGVEEMT